MSTGYEMHVIPNTHWDREWLYNFQDTRMFLVQFMDKLLDILDKEPEYASYLLDSQTVPLEDYLEARPESRERVVKHVAGDRLHVGPWYTLPEEFNVSGESLVRNLVVGHRVARQFGKVTKTGYTPFSYGQNSQMAQIYRGFGIDTILFYHGITAEETKSEFLLEAPDGSRVLGSRMGSYARYNFYYGVYRPAVYGRKNREREYSWTQGGMPFHLAGAESHQSHHFLMDVQKSIDDSNLKQALADLKREELKHARTRHLAYMQGMDSTEPDLLEVDLVRRAKKLVAPGDVILFSSLPAYLDRIREAVKGMDLTVLKGERRTPKSFGHRMHLFGDVTSSRTRQKQKNAMTEHALQRVAEPFCVAASTLGAEYPVHLMDLAWRYLLRSHPHDTISGAGIDQIERDAMYRLDQARNIADGLKRRALAAIQLRIDNSKVANDEIVLTVFNPSPYERSEVVTAFIDLDEQLGIEFIGVYDAVTGKRVEHQQVSRERELVVVRHLGDTPMSMWTGRIKLHVPVDRLPGIGYRTYILRREESAKPEVGSLLVGRRALENEYVRVAVADNGTLTVTDKTTEHVYTGLNEFEDGGEIGQAWWHISPKHDEVISSVGAPFSVSVVESGPLSATLRIEHRMLIPVGIDEGESDRTRRLEDKGDAVRRSKERREMVITSDVRLVRGGRSVEVTTAFENVCQFHRLRVLFPTYLQATVSAAETPFDVVEREIDRPEGSIWALGPNPTHPMGRFVDVSDGKTGLAIVNDGLREFEVSDDPERRISITLMRAFQIELTTVAWVWERHPEMELTQSPGRHGFTYRIVPHAGTWVEGGVFDEVERLNVPVEVAQVGPHGGDLPQAMSFLGISPRDLVMSALKPAEDGRGIVMRVYNPTAKGLTGTVTAWKPIKAVELLSLSEEETYGGLEPNGSAVAFDVGPKKIVTVRLVLG